MTTRQTKTVHQAIAAVMRDVRPVGKRGRNEEAGYSFRTIDDVMTALSSAMSKHGVHVAPKVLTHYSIERRNEDGGLAAIRVVELEVRFRFYGPNGDHVDVTTWGEGLDGSDKATSKAHTAALKNALLPTFMIPSEDVVDADASSPARSDGSDDAHRRIVEGERQRRQDEEAAALLRDDAPREVVDGIRRAVLVAADGISDLLARAETLEGIRRQAAARGALGATVLLPDAWGEVGDVEEVPLHELISGARSADLPPSGETLALECQGDPWQTDPKGGKA